MKQTIYISSEQLRNRAAHIVQSIPLEVEHEVVIKPRKINRSAEQNGFYWRIITIIGADLGMNKDEMHEVYKEMFLIPIFVRDDEDYASLYSAAYLDGPKKALKNLTSTTRASVKQMSELINDITHHATSLGIRLPAQEWQQ